MNLASCIQAAILVAAIILGTAICGGAWGPSDLELRVRAGSPTKQQQP